MAFKKYESSTSLDDAAITPRLYNCLRNDGLLTVGDVRERGLASLRYIPNLGKVCLREAAAEFFDAPAPIPASPPPSIDYEKLAAAILRQLAARQA